MEITIAETPCLIKKMSDVSGLPESHIMSKSRKWPLPACRWFIGAELMNMGFPSTVAAKNLGLDHATLLYGRKQIKKMKKSRRFRWENEIYERFKESINADKQK